MYYSWFVCINSDIRFALHIDLPCQVTMQIFWFACKKMLYLTSIVIIWDYCSTGCPKPVTVPLIHHLIMRNWGLKGNFGLCNDRTSFSSPDNHPCEQLYQQGERQMSKLPEKHCASVVFWWYPGQRYRVTRQIKVRNSKFEKISN